LRKDYVLNLLLLVAGLIFVVLHAPLLGMYIVYFNIEDLFLAIFFLTAGFLLIWLSRMMAGVAVKKVVPEFKYGASHLGCIFKGLGLSDVITIYLFTEIVAVLVCAIEGKLGEISEVAAAIYFILTIIICIIYAIFCHPYITYAKDDAFVVNSIKSKLKTVKSISYVRTSGLLLYLGGSTVLLIRSPPFEGASPLIGFILSPFNREEELTQLIIAATFKNSTEYFSLSSLVDCPAPPKVAETFEKNYVEIKVDGELIMGVKTRVILDIPHPEKRLHRLRGEAIVVYTDLKRKILKRMDKSVKYSAMFLSKIIPIMINYLRE